MNLNYKCYNANGEQVLEEGKKVKCVQSIISQWSVMQTSLFFSMSVCLNILAVFSLVSAILFIVFQFK